MHCKTALAQAEVEYEEQETPSVYVKFPLVAPLPGLAGRAAPVGRHLDDDALDPAGQPGRRGEPEREVRGARHGRRDPRRRRRPRRRRSPGSRGSSPRGASGRFEGDRARRGSSTGIRGSSGPGRIAAASFVAMDAGTGLVHIAPGHGEEDYELGRSLGLPIYNPVDDDGRFIPEVAHFAGPHRLGGEPADHRAPRGARRAGRRGARSPTRIPTAGAARTRRSSGPPSSGSSRWTRRRAAAPPGRCASRPSPPCPPCSGSRPGARSASPT